MMSSLKRTKKFDLGNSPSILDPILDHYSTYSNESIWGKDMTMNEQTDIDLQAELAALRQKLTNLEAEHRELKRQAARACRPTFSRNFLLSAVAMVYSSQSPACFVRWTR